MARAASKASWEVYLGQSFPAVLMPTSMRRILAAGALQPADVNKRFEVAVLICLIQAMADACRQSAGQWTVEYGLIRPADATSRHFAVAMAT